MLIKFKKDSDGIEAIYLFLFVYYALMCIGILLFAFQNFSCYP